MFARTRSCASCGPRRRSAPSVDDDAASTVVPPPRPSVRGSSLRPAARPQRARELDRVSLRSGRQLLRRPLRRASTRRCRVRRLGAPRLHGRLPRPAGSRRARGDHAIHLAAARVARSRRGESVRVGGAAHLRHHLDRRRPRRRRARDVARPRLPPPPRPAPAGAHRRRAQLDHDRRVAPHGRLRRNRDGDAAVRSGEPHRALHRSRSGGRRGPRAPCRLRDRRARGDPALLRRDAPRRLVRAEPAALSGADHRPRPVERAAPPADPRLQPRVHGAARCGRRDPAAGLDRRRRLPADRDGRTSRSPARCRTTARRWWTGSRRR